MFGFRKKNQQPQPQQPAEESGDGESQVNATGESPEAAPLKKKGGGLDKLVMGAIIGVAVGSVVGLAVNPPKPKDKNSQTPQKGLFGKILGMGSKPEDKKKTLKKIPREGKQE